MKRLATLALTAILAVGCSSTALGPPVSTDRPSGSPGPRGFVLRTSLHQAIPPASTFDTLRPPVLIEDGIALVQAPQDAMFPPGLVTILQQHTISETGVRRIVEGAKAAGLLTGQTDFAPNPAPGSKVAEIVLIVDGVEHRLTGDPDRQIICVTSPCEPLAGSDAAFAGFWARLADLNGLAGEELGPATVHEPERLALLLTEPRVDTALPVEYAEWPLDDVPMGQFGVELPGSPSARCGVVEGGQVGVFLEALRAGNAYTRWRDGSGDELGIVSRPLFPGEPSPCEPG